MIVVSLQSKTFTIKRNELLIHVTTEVDFKIIILIERSQTKPNK